MQERRISEDDVEAALNYYHTSYTDEDGNLIYVGNPGGRRIAVVVRNNSEPAHIITTWD